MHPLHGAAPGHDHHAVRAHGALWGVRGGRLRGQGGDVPDVPSACLGAPHDRRLMRNAIRSHPIQRNGLSDRRAAACVHALPACSLARWGLLGRAGVLFCMQRLRLPPPPCAGECAGLWRPAWLDAVHHNMMFLLLSLHQGVLPEVFFRWHVAPLACQAGLPCSVQHRLLS